MRYKFLGAIRKLRKSRRLKQSELADLIGTTQSVVSRIESGNYNPETATLFATAAALDAEIVFVPRRALKMVQDIIEAHVRQDFAPQHYDPGSVADDVFIPDPSDDEDDAREPKL